MGPTILFCSLPVNIPFLAFERWFDAISGVNLLPRGMDLHSLQTPGTRRDSKAVKCLSICIILELPPTGGNEGSRSFTYSKTFHFPFHEMKTYFRFMKNESSFFFPDSKKKKILLKSVNNEKWY